MKACVSFGLLPIVHFISELYFVFTLAPTLTRQFCLVSWWLLVGSWRLVACPVLIETQSQPSPSPPNPGLSESRV
jgi:hypothetical protein